MELKFSKVQEIIKNTNYVDTNDAAEGAKRANVNIMLGMIIWFCRKTRNCFLNMRW